MLLKWLDNSGKSVQAGDLDHSQAQGHQKFHGSSFQSWSQRRMVGFSWAPGLKLSSGCDCAPKWVLEDYVALKKWNHAICSKMDGPGDDKTKLSTSDRERQMPYITYMWALNRTHINLSMKQKWTHWHREQTCGCQGGERGRGMD